MNKLLIIDDNPDIQAANEEYLTKKGYDVDTAFSGAEAFDFLRKKTYDCIVLDVLMPGLDGYAICAEARKTVETPIIFLSCMDGEENRIKGLMAGGDDYMTKPYSVKELTARIYAQIRRDKVFSGVNSDFVQPTPHVTYDKGTRTLAISGTNLILARKEYEILSLLIVNPGVTVEKDALLRCVDGEESTLAVYIKRIRDKLAMDKALGEIITVFGEGYCYKPGKGASL